MAPHSLALPFSILSALLSSGKCELEPEVHVGEFNTLLGWGVEQCKFLTPRVLNLVFRTQTLLEQEHPSSPSGDWGRNTNVGPGGGPSLLQILQQQQDGA